MTILIRLSWQTILFHTNWKDVRHLKDQILTICVFNRPNVARAVLKTPLLLPDWLINSVIICENIFKMHPVIWGLQPQSACPTRFSFRFFHLLPTPMDPVSLKKYSMRERNVFSPHYALIFLLFYSNLI